MIALLRYPPALIYMGLLVYFSSLPSNATSGLKPPMDKVLHFGAYGVLAVLFALWLPTVWKKAHPFFAFLIPFVFTVIFGMTDEWHQSFVPHRDSSWQDLLADVLGAFVFLIGYHVVFLRRKSL